MKVKEHLDSERPRSGRPPKIENHKITKYLANKPNGVFPKVMAMELKKEEKVRYTESGICDMLHRCNYTAKVPDPVHKRKADPAVIKEWQEDAKERILRAKKRQIQALRTGRVLDAAGREAKSGPWSPKGQKIHVVYDRRHQKRVIYGSISSNDKFFMRAKKFDGPTFLKYVKKMVKVKGKVALILDQAPQHRTKDFKQFVEENPDKIRVLYLPTGTPELNAIEELWRQLKSQPFMYEYYEDIDDRMAQAMRYLNRTKVALDIEKYLFRTPIAKTF